MDYKYGHPLYTEDDRDIALAHLVEYLENNNIPEHDAISNKPFKYIQPTIPSETTRHMVEMQFGVNVINIANVLTMQDLFFKMYMPHLGKYLDYAGIKSSFSYMRFSQIIPAYIIHMFTHHNRAIPLKYWDPNVFWTDYNYKKDDYDTNITNPLTNFYTATLNFHAISNYDFIKEMDLLNGITDRDIDKNELYSINVKLLPAFNPIYMMRVTKLIHKYF